MTAARKHQLRHVLDSLNLLLATRLQVPYGSRGWWKLNNACAYLGWAYVPELIPNQKSFKAKEANPRERSFSGLGVLAGAPKQNLSP